MTDTKIDDWFVQLAQRPFWEVNARYRICDKCQRKADINHWPAEFLEKWKLMHYRGDCVPQPEEATGDVTFRESPYVPDNFVYLMPKNQPFTLADKPDSPELSRQFKCPTHGLFEALGYDNPVFYADKVANCPKCGEKCWEFPQPPDDDEAPECGYVIYKREKCQQCVNGKKELYNKNDPDMPHVFIPCTCEDGYIETAVPLLDVLARLRWGNQVLVDKSKMNQFVNLRIEEDK